jgi:hypothetical protein
MGELEPALNKVIDVVNDINECIEDIREAAVIVCGGFKVDVDLEGALEHDKVILQLTKADGTLPTVDDAKKLAADEKVKKADAALAKARKALYKDMEAAYSALKVEADVLAGGPASMAAFNTALGELRTAVGAAYKVTVVVKSAGKGGAACVRFDMTKAVFASLDKDHTWEPVSVIDIACTKEAKNIYAAEVSVAEALAGLTKAVAAAEAGGLTVSFTMKKKKLVPKIEGGEPAEGEEGAAEKAEGLTEKKAAVRKAVSSANSQLFKLFKAARNANGLINLSAALKAVFEALKAKVMTLPNAASKSISVSQARGTWLSELDCPFHLLASSLLALKLTLFIFSSSSGIDSCQPNGQMHHRRHGL